MTVVAPARRGGASTGHLWLACHEAGHAVAHLVCNQARGHGPMLKSVSILASGERLGFCEADARFPLGFSRDTPDYLRQPMRVSALLDLIDTLAGPIAELRCRQGSLGPWLGMAPAMAAILAFPPDVKPTGDFEVAAVKARLWGEPSLILSAAWNTSRALVCREWAGIRAVGQLLRERGELDGEQFEAAWLSMRPSLRRRSAYDAHEGAGSFGDIFGRLLALA